MTGASYSVGATNQFALTWNDNDIQDTAHGLKSLLFTNFEVVDLSPADYQPEPDPGRRGNFRDDYRTQLTPGRPAG